MRARLQAGLVAGVALALGVAAGAVAAPPGPAQTWKGYVTDTWCGWNRVNQPPTASCTRECVKDRHAQYAFFNFQDKKVYVLEPQAEAAKYAGETVVVRGRLEGRVRFTTANGAASGEVILASAIQAAKAAR